jgi:hypothetical protein
MRAIGPPLRGHEDCGGFTYGGDRARRTKRGMSFYVRHGPSGTYECHKCGFVYSGEWHENKRHGEGWGVPPNGEGVRYKGTWAHNDMQGQGRLTVRRATPLCREEYKEGRFLVGRMHGHGIHFQDMEYGRTYTGDFVEGFACGRGTIASSRLTYVGQFDRCVENGVAMGLPHGEGEITFHALVGHKTGLFVGTVTRWEVFESGSFKSWSGEGKYIHDPPTPNWQEGTFEGSRLVRGRSFFKNNLYVGTFDVGGLCGEGEIYYMTGYYYKGTADRDQPHGEGCMWGPLGNTLTGRWNRGKPQGTMTWAKGGDTYEGEWAVTASGRGTYTWADGARWRGIFYSKDGVDFIMRGADCEIMEPDGSGYRGGVLDDTFEGRGEAWGPLDDPWRHVGEFKAGKATGKGEWRHLRTGALRRGVWDMGSLHGPGIEALPLDRGVFKGTFDHGKRHGTFVASVAGKSFRMRYEQDELIESVDIEYVPVCGLLEATEGEAPRPPPSSAAALPACVCCMERPSTFILVPCGHACLCTSCAPNFGPNKPNLASCPLCRVAIRTVQGIVGVDV